jgi:hypothetical protein
MGEAARGAAAESEPDYRPLDGVQPHLLAIRPVAVAAVRILKHIGFL